MEFNTARQQNATVSDWFILVINIWILTVPLIFCIQFQDNFTKNPQTLYLLSALVQSLAAIFALVFTISLVAAQLFSRYSHRMLATIFDKYTIGYICIFIFTIMLCLLTINKATNHHLVKISLSSGSLSLLLLIPYFLRFKELLNPEYTIKNLKQVTEKKIIENPERIPDEITRLDNFAMSALALKDYDTFVAGIRSLESLVKIIVLENRNIGEYERTFFESMFKNLTSRLRDIAISGIDDPRTPYVVIDSLKRIGVTSANEKIDTYSTSICEILGEIGSRADQNGITAIMKDSAGLLAAFRYICNTAIKNRLENTLLVSSTKVKNVAIDATKSKSPEIVESAIEQLREYSLESLTLSFRTAPDVNMATYTAPH